MSGDAPMTGLAPLTLWPTADWRFLLPEPVGRVGYVGSPAPGEIEVLLEAGVRVVSLTGAALGPGRGPSDGPGAAGDAAGSSGPAVPGSCGQAAAASSDLDVVVVSEDRADALDLAVAALRPDGWVLLRVGRGAHDPAWPSLRARAGAGPLAGPVARPLAGLLAVTRGAAGTWTRRARAAGLEVAACYWHAPDARRCSYVVALDGRTAVDAVLRRHQGVRFGAAKSLVARALNRTGLAHLLARHVTIVTRAGDGTPARRRPPPDGVRTGPPVLPTAVEARLGGAARFLVTPWFEASRHVVCLYLDPATAVPVAVAKLPRRPWDVGGIRHEAGVLRDLARRTDALAGRAPAVRDLVLEGRPYLLESAVVGAAVGPEAVRSTPRETIEQALGLLAAMPTTGTTGQDPTWFARLVEQPLTDVAANVALAGVPRLVDETLAHLEALRGADLPLVFEHGDLGHPNLVLGAHGLGAVDWERAEPYGLPGHDLCFFLQYAAESLRRTFERPGQLRAFDDAFTGPRAWARPWLQRYARERGLDDSWWPALILTSWARSSAGLLRRLGPGGPRSPEASTPVSDGGLAAAFEADRDLALWRHAVDRFGRLLT